MSIYVWYGLANALIALSLLEAWKTFVRGETFSVANRFLIAIWFAVTSLVIYKNPPVGDEHAWIACFIMSCTYTLCAVTSFVRGKWAWRWMQTLHSFVLGGFVVWEFGEPSLPYVGAGINVLALLWFAAMILKGEINPTSPASWGMWMILDSLLTGASYFAAPSELQWILPAAWTLGALVVTIACVIRGKFSWGWRETLCAALAGVAAYFWLTINAEAGVVAGAIAITIAGIPLFIDMWKCPNRGLLPPAIVTCVACTLFIVSAYGSFGVFLPATSFVYNATLVVILLRKK